MNFRRNLLIVTLFVFALSLRLLPYLLMQFRDQDTTPGMAFYPWNFSPLMAICLFSGAIFADRRFSYGLPLAILIASDLGIGLLMQNVNFAFHALVPFTYVCMLLSAAFGRAFLRRREAWRVGASAIAAELFFFLVTNAGNWWLMPTHPQTLEGLMLTYVDALPFFGRSIFGTLMFSGALFGSYAFAERFVTRAETSPQAV